MEQEIRLVDILGKDNVSCPSDSEILAPYSPPRSDIGSRLYDPDPLEQPKHESKHDAQIEDPHMEVRIINQDDIKEEARPELG